MQGTSATVGLGDVRSLGQRRRSGNGSLVYFSGTHAQAINDRWAFKLSARRLFAGSAVAADRADSRHRRRRARAYPAVQEHRHDPAEVRRPRSTTTSRTAGSCRSPAASPAPKASCTPASGPSTSTRARRWAMAKVNSRDKGLRAAFFTNILDGDATNLLTRDVNCPADRLRFQDQDLRLRSVQRQRARDAARGQLRRQPALQQRSISRSRRTADNRTEFGVYGQDEIFLSNHFRWIVGARVDRFDYLDDCRVLAAHDVPDQAERATRRSGCRTTAPIARRRSSTTSSTSPSSSRSTSGVQSRARRPGLPVADQARWATRI